MPVNRLIYIAIAFMLSLPLAGQEAGEDPVLEKYLNSDLSTREIDRSDWERATQDLDYTIEDRSSNQGKEQDTDKPAERGNRFIFILIGVILGTILLAFIIGLFSGYIKLHNPKIKDTNLIALEEVEEKLFETDLSGLIRQAIDAGDYPLAVRLYYLVLLKELALQKKITWKKDKTNREYLRELSGTKLYPAMAELSLRFEEVRYGRKTLDQRTFSQLETQFRECLAFINPGLLVSQK